MADEPTTLTRAVEKIGLLERENEALRNALAAVITIKVSYRTIFAAELKGDDVIASLSRGAIRVATIDDVRLNEVNALIGAAIKARPS